jgi:type VI secretion system secreted protein Hcp
MAIYLKLDGVDGNSKDSKHEKWIDIHNWSWGASSSVNMYGGGKSGGSSQIEPVQFSCITSSVTPTLMKKLLEGTVIPTGTLEMTMRIDDAEEGTWLKVEFTNIMLASMSQSHDKNNPESYDNVSIVFEKVTQKIADQKDDNSLDAEKEFTITPATNKVE